MQNDIAGSRLLLFGFGLLITILVVLWSVLPLLLWSQLNRLRDEMRKLNDTVSRIKDDTADVPRLVRNTDPLPGAIRGGRFRCEDGKSGDPGT
jgi:hypothetical protein